MNASEAIEFMKSTGRKVVLDWHVFPWCYGAYYYCSQDKIVRFSLDDMSACSVRVVDVLTSEKFLIQYINLKLKEYIK